MARANSCYESDGQKMAKVKAAFIPNQLLLTLAVGESLDDSSLKEAFKRRRSVELKHGRSRRGMDSAR